MHEVPADLNRKVAQWKVVRLVGLADEKRKPPSWDTALAVYCVLLPADWLAPSLRAMTRLSSLPVRPKYTAICLSCSRPV